MVKKICRIGGELIERDVVHRALLIKTVFRLRDLNRVANYFNIQRFFITDDGELHRCTDRAANLAYRFINGETVRRLSVNRGDLIASPDAGRLCGSPLEGRDNRQNAVLHINLHTDTGEASGNSIGEHFRLLRREVDGIRVVIRSGEAPYRSEDAFFNRRKRGRSIRDDVVCFERVPRLPEIGKVGSLVGSRVKPVADERNIRDD